MGEAVDEMPTRSERDSNPITLNSDLTDTPRHDLVEFISGCIRGVIDSLRDGDRKVNISKEATDEIGDSAAEQIVRCVLEERR